MRVVRNISPHKVLHLQRWRNEASGEVINGREFYAIARPAWKRENRHVTRDIAAAWLVMTPYLSTRVVDGVTFTRIETVEG